MGLIDYFFNGKSKNLKVLFAPDSIQLSIIEMMSELIENAYEYFNKDVPDKEEIVMTEEVRSLVNLGFTSNKKVLQYYKRVKEVEDKHEAELKRKNVLYESIVVLKALIDARKVYGKDTLLLSFDQFEKLCERYGLKCGTFSNFIGDIPDNKMDELKKLMEREHTTESFITPVYPVTSVRNAYTMHGNDELAHVNRVCERFPLLAQNATYDRTFTYKEVMFLNGKNYTYRWIDVTNGSSIKFFIAAPTGMFKDSYTIVSGNDPFICARGHYGIFIFTRWGEEANDQLIRKMEEFNEKLDELNF